MNIREQAEDLNTLARGLHDRGELQEAMKLYRKAARVDPTWATPLFNIGLLFKQQRRWRESLKYNRRATVVGAEYEPAWWNLGIAATALRRWRQARAAWRGFGIDLPNGDGLLDFPCGFTPIRLNPDGEGEVVWASRLDPARAGLCPFRLGTAPRLRFHQYAASSRCAMTERSLWPSRNFIVARMTTRRNQECDFRLPKESPSCPPCRL